MTVDKMGCELWRPLKLPTLDELKRTPNFQQINGEERQWPRPPAGFVLDLSNGTFPQPIQPYLDALSNQASRHQRGVYLNSLSEQLVYGSHHFYAFMGPRNEVTFQGIEEARLRIEYHLAHQTLSDKLRVPRLRRNGDGFEVSYGLLEDSDIISLNGPVFFGSPVEPMNWGMWLLQGIPSAWQFLNTGQKGRLLCFSSAPFQRSLLSFLGVDEEKVVDQRQWVTYSCEMLSLLQYSRDTSFAVRPYDREVYDNVTRMARSRADGVSPEMIFVSRRSVSRRKGGTYRALLNEGELLDAMRSIGFAIIEPESLSFAEQVCLFHNAKVVVGLGGAGMFNVVFCKPGTKVITIESSVAFSDNHATLFASLGHQYGVIFGSRDITDETWPHHRWSLDVPQTTRGIRRFI